MLDKFIEYIRRWLFRMAKKEDVVSKLKADIVISDDMLKAVNLWNDMYLNKAEWLEENKGLNLPSSICSEIARLATIEMKSEISGKNSKRAEYLNTFYQQVIDDIRTQVEYGCAVGGLILKPYIDGDKISVDYIQANNFYPTAFDGAGKIISAVFIDQKKLNDKYYTRLEHHQMTNEGVYITNNAFISHTEHEIGKEIPLDSIDEWALLQPEVLLKGVNKPLFGYFKTPLANNIDTRSPLGVSVYSKAVDLIRQADEQYSRLLWEFEASEYAVYIDELAMKPYKDAKGKITGYNIPQKQKRIFKGLSLASTQNEFFKEWCPNIREQSLINGLNEILCRIEDVCGLARGTFSNPQGEAKTATELKILRQRSYATICDTQKSIKTALDELVYAMDMWATLGNLAPKSDIETSFEFDDSIVTDRQAEFIEKQQLVTMGILQPWELRMWYLGETEEQAKKSLQEQQNKVDLFNQPEE